jgi:hypothetical protein
MSTLIESSLTFHFDPRQWALRKWDEHRYYEGLRGQGLKAVDFVGIWNGEYLLLGEVKNFPRHSRTRLPEAEALGEALALKIQDTFMAIDVVGRYFQRSWRYRAFGPWARRLPAQRWEWAFWHHAARLSEDAARCVAAFWLEGTPVDDGYLGDVSEYLRQVLPDFAAEIWVGEAHTPRPWTGGADMQVFR